MNIDKIFKTSKGDILYCLNEEKYFSVDPEAIFLALEEDKNSDRFPESVLAWDLEQDIKLCGGIYEMEECNIQLTKTNILS